MRSFFGFVAMVAFVVVILVTVALPMVARPLIVSMVRDASPFEGPPLDVDADVGPALLSGTVDRIAIRGLDQGRGGARLETLTLTVRGFSILDRTFASLEGTLGGVRLPRDDGSTIELRTVRFNGPSTAVTAVAVMDAAATERLVRSTLATGGIVPDVVRLQAGAIAIELGALLAEGRLEVRDGALVLVAGALVPPTTILEAAPGADWRLERATVAPDGVTVEATIDLEAALAS